MLLAYLFRIKALRACASVKPISVNCAIASAGGLVFVAGAAAKNKINNLKREGREIEDGGRK
jgi:hypothetical protein